MRELFPFAAADFGGADLPGAGLGRDSAHCLRLALRRPASIHTAAGQRLPSLLGAL